MVPTVEPQALLGLWVAVCEDSPCRAAHGAVHTSPRSQHTQERTVLNTVWRRELGPWDVFPVLGSSDTSSALRSPPENDLLRYLLNSPSF